MISAETLRALLSLLGGLGWPERMAFFLAQNLVVLAGALAFGAVVVRALPRHRIARVPPAIDRAEVGLALCTVVLNALVTAAGYQLYLWGVLRFREDVGPRFVLDAAVLLFGMDFLMYWLHRAAHLRWTYFIHRPHHRYVHPRPLDLFVLSPFETVSFGGLWLAFLCLYSPSWLAVVLYLTLNVFFGVLGHTGVELLPPSWTRAPVVAWLGSSVFHAGHHADERHNFGFYTVLWDRLFGTYAEHHLLEGEGEAGPRDGPAPLPGE